MLDFDTIARDRAARHRHWYDKGIYSDYTFADALRDGVAKYGDTPLVFHSRVRPRVTTVRELYDESERLASAFHHLGLVAGDRMMLMLPTWYEATLAYEAALKLGLTIIPVVAIYGSREIAFIMRQSGARALVIPDRWRGHDYVERARGAEPLPAMEHLIVIGDDVPDDAIGFDSLMAHKGTDYPTGIASADDVCTIIYTSGTTSDPKGVKHSHNTQLCDINAINAGIDPPPAHDQDAGPNLCVFPAGHIASFIAMMRGPLYGQRTIYMDQWFADDAARLIERYGASSSGGSPIFLSTLMKAAQEIGADISSLRSFSLGGSAVTPENVRWTDQLGFPSGRIYGSTEHPVISVGTDGSFEKRAYTDGLLTPRNSVRIIDDDGNDLPVGEIGEIVSRGPRLFLGYVDAELDRSSFLEGDWYRTGDIGRLDAEGYLTITDRKKDIIIRGGENISAKEVEDGIAEMPEVIEVAVVAMPDPVMSERVCAFVVLRPGASLGLDRIVAHFAARGIARQKCPERLIVVDDMPRTTSGKVKKFDLREQLRKDANAAAA